MNDHLMICCRYSTTDFSSVHAINIWSISQIVFLNWPLSSQGFVMALKRRRATSPSSSVSGGDFDDSQASSLVPSIGRKRRRTSNIPTVDPVILQISVTVS